MLQKIKSLLAHKTEVNYLYFSLLFIILSVFSLSHFFFMGRPFWGIQIFCFAYTLGQALLETWAFIFIAYSLKRWTPKWFFFLFIAISFIILLIHFTDFTLIRLMDSSISYVFKFLFGQGFDHLFTAFSALNMHIGMIFLILLAILIIPFLGVLLYWATNNIAKKKPWKLSQGQIALAIIGTGLFLFFLEVLAHPYLDRFMYDKFQKRIPLGATFFTPTPKCIELPKALAYFRDEKEIRKKLPTFKVKKKPNIYLFVVETFRKDFVTEETAPHLTSFGESHINIPISFANANWTPLSWFAIFQSDFPYDWTAMRDHWTHGSIPLQLLKQMGYKIKVYSSADLRYFSMDEVMFGKKRKLADKLEEYSSYRSLEPCDRDRLCIETFKKDLASQNGKEGNVYLFFFDGTHSEYSFPKDFPLKFEPIAKQIDYLTISAKEIEPVKNRYRNAIYHIDHLMGEFFSSLQKEKIYDEAVILVTGDHGEEFYEDGSLFHGTHLNRYQLEVPIFCKFGKEKAKVTQATHIDIFPSILHYITKKDVSSTLFDGRSILNEKNQPGYRVAVMQNGSDTPVEFSVEKGQDKLQVRFLHPKDIYNQTRLEVISYELEGKPSTIPPESILNAFPEALTPLLMRR